MQDQITVRLPAELGSALRRTSRELRRRPSDVVRLALEAYLQPGGPGRSAAGKAAALIGSLKSGAPDLAERHRDYLIASLRRGR